MGADIYTTFWELNEVKNVANHDQAKGKIENLVVCKLNLLKIQVPTRNDADGEGAAQDQEFHVEVFVVFRDYQLDQLHVKHTKGNHEENQALVEYSTDVFVAN